MLFLLMLMAISCTEINFPSNPDIVGDDRSITADRDENWLSYLKRIFPHEVGTSWTYVATDSGTAYRDTAELAVTGVYLANGSSIVYVLNYVGDSYPIYDQFGSDGSMFWGGIFTHPTLHFPLYVGKGWGFDDRGVPESADTSTVVDNSPIRVPAGYYSEVYHVVRIRRFNRLYFQEDTWFVPHVGVVKDILNTYSNPDVGVLTLELLSYSKPFVRAH
ncbi:MAG TPA: hypothetical protein VI215_06250 [Bacteroidota bacterium]